MQLKRYQERVVAEVRTYLQALSTHRTSTPKHAAQEAWDEIAAHRPGLREYQRRKDGLGRDMPCVCVKVPTGGGKTLLATQILGEIHRTLLRERNGTGLVLWIVPSDQIYKDTLRRLRDRRDFHRESLEHAVSRRIEVWEKHEIARITPSQLASCLNILVLILASTNRETKDQLRFFQDSGGSIVQHFPPESAPARHKALLDRVTNLDALANDPERGEFLVKTSVANLVRLCEPCVILDEGHKAASDLARRTIEGMNPAIVVEFSATPNERNNVLVRVSGKDLLDEQMIKLPINVSHSSAKSWQECLALAHDRRKALATTADKLYRTTQRRIRPIVLVQVERTGKDQRDSGFVHSEDVKEHLVQRLAVPESAIAIKSSEKDDIEGIDLLDENCAIEWIVTKAALQEGWDCPFAYILVSLSNTGGKTSMTQLVGRILRQPFAEKTHVGALDESYVYCLRKRAAEVTGQVKQALEREGYEDFVGAVVQHEDAAAAAPKKTASMRPQFRGLYARKFDGKVYLPRFCVRRPDGGFEALDYFGHLLAKVDVATFDFDAADWDLSGALRESQDAFYRITLGEEPAEAELAPFAPSADTDERVVGWLVTQVADPSLGHKQTRTLVTMLLDRVLRRNDAVRGKLAWVKFALLDRVRAFVERNVDAATERAFASLHTEKRLQFFLECRECRFELPPTVEVRGLRNLTHDDGRPIQRSLFDFVPDQELNELERAVAFCLDEHPKVLWWYRNLVGPQNFAIQGFRRDRIFPDFVVQQQHKDRVPAARVLVIESKGAHLKGNADTAYKRDVADYFEQVGHRVTWQELAKDFSDQQFRFQVLDEGDHGDGAWRDRLRKILESPFRS